jgi:hypothetical protein
MALVPSLSSAAHTAIGGIRKELGRFNRAAEHIASAASSPAAVVELSPAARAAVRPPSTLEEALVESREASAMLAANVRVVATSADMSRELIDLLGRQQSKNG